MIPMSEPMFIDGDPISDDVEEYVDEDDLLAGVDSAYELYVGK